MPPLALHGISVLQEGVALLRTTDRGRIFSYADPALGTTANTAFVAVAYATLLKPFGDPRARTYTCWALQQKRPTPVPLLALALGAQACLSHGLYACAQHSSFYCRGLSNTVLGDLNCLGDQAR